MSLKINNDTANGSSILQPSNTATGDVTHTLPSFTTELAPRMQLMTAQNSTSGTSIDFTGIPSWAKRITVMFSGVSTNGTSHRLMQLGTQSGVETTVYNSVTSFSGQTGGVASTSGFIIFSDSATRIQSGSYTLALIGANIFVGSSVIAQTDATYTMQSAGSKTLSGTLDRIRITTVNGTDLFDAGQINILVEG